MSIDAEPGEDEAEEAAEGPSGWLVELRRRPLMLLSLALIAGMIVAHLSAPAPAAALLACGLCALIVFVTLRSSSQISTAGLFAAVFFAGVFIYATHATVPPDDLCHLAGLENAAIEGVVRSAPEPRGWRQRFRLSVEALGAGDHRRQVGGYARARCPVDAQVALGDRVRLSRATVELPPEADAPGEFDYRAWLARQGVRSIVTAREVRVIGRDRGWDTRLRAVGLSLRRRVVRSIDAAMPGADGSLYSRLLVSMVYGIEAASLPDALVDEFRRAGTVHLLVVSGAQVTMIAFALILLTRRRRLRSVMRWWQALVALAGVAVLVLIVGIEASISRAVAMFVLLILAGLTSRDYDLYTAIALSAALILVCDPGALLSLSLQLTFAATLGVALFLPREALTRADGSSAAPPLPGLRAVVWGTFGAWVMTTPLLAHGITQFAVSGNLANLANVPLSFLVMVLGFAALPVALLPPLAPVLTAICWVARGLLRMVMHVNAVAAALPMAFVRDMPMSVPAVLAWYAVVVLLLQHGTVRRARRRLDEALLRMHPMWPYTAGFALVCVLVGSYLAAAAPLPCLEVDVLPVGAGQCALARTASGATLMIDCGGGAGGPDGGRKLAENVVLPYLSRRSIKRLDAVAITHWDADHYNALPHLLQRVPVGRLLLPPELPEARAPTRLEHVPATPVRAEAGGMLRMGNDVTVQVLEPRRPMITGTRDDANNNSVVMMLEHDAAHLLFTGDLQTAGVRRLLDDASAAGWDLRADVLVLPHHGRTAEGLRELLDRVHPRWAIASCDRRADVYMTEEALQLLQERGITLLRTDQAGAIALVSDGTRFEALDHATPSVLTATLALARQ